MGVEEQTKRVWHGHTSLYCDRAYNLIYRNVRKVVMIVIMIYDRVVVFVNVTCQNTSDKLLMENIFNYYYGEEPRIVLSIIDCII